MTQPTQPDDVTLPRLGLPQLEMAMTGLGAAAVVGRTPKRD
jgi:hypothetical protein